MSYLDKVLKKAEKEHDLLKHPYVGTEHLLLALLSYDDDLTDSLKKYNLTYNKFKRKLRQVIGEGSNKSSYILYTPMLRKVLNIASNNKDITNIDLFNAIIEANEGIAIRVMEMMNIDIENIKIANNMYMKYDDNIIITHREKEIDEIFQILMRKNKCNPLLIGDAGVGKTAIVEEIERRLINNNIPSCLNGYKILNVDMSSIVAGTKYRGDFEGKLNDILKSAEKNKVILFIDEIHTLIHAGGAEGAISASDIIKPYLARGSIKCIGATTTNEYHEMFELDKALDRRFQKIIIKEPDYNETLDILNNLVDCYEKYHNVSIDKELIKEIIDISNKYITNKRNPDKAIELLDSCCTNSKYLEQKEVTINNLYNVFKFRYGLDLGNSYIKNILDNKTIILTNKEYINTINCLSNKILKIDGDKFITDDDIFDLLGNPNYKHSYYLLKNVIDETVGIITITNYNCNLILKEFINKLLSSRHIIDNYGNNLSLENYIIIMEDIDNNNSIGFTETYKFKNSIKFTKMDEKELLLSS